MAKRFNRPEEIRFSKSPFVDPAGESVDIREQKVLAEALYTKPDGKKEFRKKILTVGDLKSGDRYRVGNVWLSQWDAIFRQKIFENAPGDIKKLISDAKSESRDDENGMIFDDVLRSEGETGKRVAEECCAIKESLKNAFLDYQRTRYEWLRMEGVTDAEARERAAVALCQHIGEITQNHATLIAMLQGTKRQRYVAAGAIMEAWSTASIEYRDELDKDIENLTPNELEKIAEGNKEAAEKKWIELSREAGHITGGGHNIGALALLATFSGPLLFLALLPVIIPAIQQANELHNAHKNRETAVKHREKIDERIDVMSSLMGANEVLADYIRRQLKGEKTPVGIEESGRKAVEIYRKARETVGPFYKKYFENKIEVGSEEDLSVRARLQEAINATVPDIKNLDNELRGKVVGGRVVNDFIPDADSGNEYKKRLGKLIRTKSHEMLPKQGNERLPIFSFVKSPEGIEKILSLSTMDEDFIKPTPFENESNNIIRQYTQGLNGVESTHAIYRMIEYELNGKNKKKGAKIFETDLLLRLLPSKRGNSLPDEDDCVGTRFIMELSDILHKAKLDNKKSNPLFIHSNDEGITNGRACAVNAITAACLIEGLQSQLTAYENKDNAGSLSALYMRKQLLELKRELHINIQANSGKMELPKIIEELDGIIRNPETAVGVLYDSEIKTLSSAAAYARYAIDIDKDIDYEELHKDFIETSAAFSEKAAETRALFSELSQLKEASGGADNSAIQEDIRAKIEAEKVLLKIAANESRLRPELEVLTKFHVYDPKNYDSIIPDRDDSRDDRAQKTSDESIDINTPSDPLEGIKKFDDSMVVAAPRRQEFDIPDLNKEVFPEETEYSFFDMER